MTRIEQFNCIKDSYSFDDLYTEYGNPNSNNIQQQPSELKMLIDIFKEYKPKRILEIGQLTGATLYYWIKHSSPDSIIAAVDIDHSNLQHAQWDVDLSKVVLITGDSTSEDVISKAREVLKEIDFVFIDGDHYSPTVESDFYNYESMVQRGIIAFHDINPGAHINAPTYDVHRVWAEILQKGYITEQFIKLPPFSPDGAFGIGVVYKNI